MDIGNEEAIAAIMINNTHAVIGTTMTDEDQQATTIVEDGDLDPPQRMTGTIDLVGSLTAMENTTVIGALNETDASGHLVQKVAHPHLSLQKMSVIDGLSSCNNLRPD